MIKSFKKFENQTEPEFLNLSEQVYTKEQVIRIVDNLMDQDFIKFNSIYAWDKYEKWKRKQGQAIYYC